MYTLGKLFMVVVGIAVLFNGIEAWDIDAVIAGVLIMMFVALTHYRR